MEKFTMLRTLQGVRKGNLHPEQFTEGETYELDDDLAGQFIELGAVKLEGVKELEVPSNKALSAPSNKSKK